MHDTQASIRKYLGADALALGAFGLLGLDPRSCTREAVEASLQQQLDRVASHAEGDTPEADEVRLALHAAAAQLLDPRVRDHLAARWKDEARRLEDDRGTPPSSIAGGQRPPTPSPDSTVRDNFTPRRRSGDDAAKFIVGAAVITVAMIGLVIAAIIVFAARPTAPVPVAGGAAAAGPTGAGTAAAPPAVDTQAAELAQAASAAATIEPSAPVAAAGRARAPRGSMVDPRKTLKDLRDAAPLARTDPAASVAALEPILRQLADWWAAYDASTRRACDDAVIECLYAMSSSLEAQTALHKLIAAPSLRLSTASSPAEAIDRPQSGERLPMHVDEVWPAAWSVGLLTRLTRERDLPTRLVAMNSAALDTSLGQSRPTLESTFESGATLAARRIPTLLLTDPQARTSVRESAVGPGGSTAAIKRWIQACSALASDDNSLERMLADGLEAILAGAKEPEEDLGVFEAIGAIASHIKWRSGGPARPRLLDWFRDSRVSDADLRVATSAIASKSGAEGVDASMILSVNPAIDARSQLRARFAQAWSIESAGGERASQVWVDAAGALRVLPPTTGVIDSLRNAAAAARLNEAARLLWRGERAAAESLLREGAVVLQIGAGLSAAATGTNVITFDVTGSGADGAWAERYFAAERSIPARLELLAQLERSGRPIGTVDASLLVQEAVIGSPMQVRYAAARIAGQWADESTVVIAALDELPLAPRTRTTADMMERITRQALPPMTDPDWELAIRRALVERLLGMLATGTTEASLEHYAVLIADSYLRAAGQEPARGAGAAAEGANRGSELLWTAVRAEADAVAPVLSAPIQLDQIDRRRTGRRTLASGPVQAFAAEQVSIAEAMAYVVCGEKPTASKGIESVINRMQTARRGSTHVFDQLFATEMAILELWLLRFDQNAGGAL